MAQHAAPVIFHIIHCLFFFAALKKCFHKMMGHIRRNHSFFRIQCNDFIKDFCSFFCGYCTGNMSFCKICSFSCIQDNIIICIVLQSLCRNIVVCLCSICNGYSRTLCRHVLWNEWFCPCLELVSNNACVAGCVASQASGSNVNVVSNVGINHAEVIVIFCTLQRINHFDGLIPILNGDIELGVVLVANTGLCQLIDSLVASLCNFIFLCINLRLCIPSLCRNLTESCIQLCRGCIGYKIRCLCCNTVLIYNVVHALCVCIVYSSSY